ncbi:MAG: class C sortase [Lachnospiraceae bacterium]|nr:class C sortase [Lachnospiraceae bacterium]
MKKKRGIGSTIILLLLLVLGVAILLYPTVADWWNTRRARSLMTEYESGIAQMDDRQTEIERKLAEAYNLQLVGVTIPDIFAELELPPHAEYDSVLNLGGQGYMGSIEIPQINVNLPIYHYTTEEVLLSGAGHLAGSSVPVGGVNTHSIITAHRGLPSARMFTDLNRLEKGDVFFLHILGETMAYQVHEIRVIEPTRTEGLGVQEGEDLCTLVTCEPYAINTHRLVVTGHRIEYTEEVYAENKVEKSAPVDMNNLLPRILCVVAGILLATLIILIIHKIDKRKKGKPSGQESSVNGEESNEGGVPAITLPDSGDSPGPKEEG